MVTHFRESNLDVHCIHFEAQNINHQTAKVQALIQNSTAHSCKSYLLHQAAIIHNVVKPDARAMFQTRAVVHQLKGERAYRPIQAQTAQIDFVASKILSQVLFLKSIRQSSH